MSWLTTQGRRRGLQSLGHWLLLLFVAATPIAAALTLAAKTPAATSPVQITSATVYANRTISVSWDIPVGQWGGALMINPTAATDATGEMPFEAGTTIDYELLNTGSTHYTSKLPLKMTVQQPVTVYVQVQLIDPWYNGTGGCQQGNYLADCDSQVVALPIDPICREVLVKAGYYSKVLVRRGHWLRRHGRYVHQHGQGVWVKARYRRIWHPPVYETRCH